MSVLLTCSLHCVIYSVTPWVLINKQRAVIEMLSKMLLYTVWVKPPPPCAFLTFFPKRLGIFNQFLRTYHTLLSTLDYKIFVQLSPTLTKLCHTKRDHPSIFFYISLELNFLVCLLSKWCHCWRHCCHIQHVCWHYKSSRSETTCHRQWSTKPSTTFENVWSLNACVSADSGHFEHIMWTR